MREEEASRIIVSLYESWYPAAVRYARRLTSHWDVAEDTVQDAFFCLYRELRKGKAIGNPKAWALRVIGVQVRVRMGAMRQDASRQDEQVSLDDLPARSEAFEPDFHIRNLCSTLSEREHEVLFLRLAEMKYREIAKELGISSSSVNTLLARALRKLQRASGKSVAVDSAPEAGNHVRQTLQ